MKKKKQMSRGGQGSGARVLAKEAQAWGCRMVTGRGRRALEVGWWRCVYCSKNLDDGRRLGVLLLQGWVKEDRQPGKLLLAGYFSITTRQYTAGVFGCPFLSLGEVDFGKKIR
jgi:hypothetical protein